MRDLSKLVQDLINIIPKEEETVITELKSRLESIEFLLLPEQIPMNEEIIYKKVSECLSNDIEYNNLKEWQKEVINKIVSECLSYDIEYDDLEKEVIEIWNKKIVCNKNFI